MARVLMHVVQPGEVAVLKGEVRLPVVLPKSGPVGSGVFEIQSLGGEAVELLEDGFQGVGSRLGAVGDDVVVIGEDCPGFELPGAFGEDVEEELLEPIASFRGMKEVGLMTGAGGDEIDSGF
jgi:hypothetical protein